MQARFFHRIYARAWKKKQLQKYSGLLPELKELVKGKTVLDYGIGKAWLWQFLEKKGINAGKVYGIDLNEQAVKPRKKGINYYFSLQDFLKEKRKADLLVLFDAIHLMKKKELLELKKLVKKNGKLLVSVPASKKVLLHNLNWLGRTAWLKEIGLEEKDYCALIKLS
ncbi:methyltransferase domain-containing protein [archaeon]|nr:methyltransferase domain-containing protein [archaeon]